MMSSIPDMVRVLISGNQAALTGVAIKKDETIIRARPGHGHHSVEALTYKPASICNSYQRATLPNETAFYGCLGEKLPLDADGFQSVKRAITLSAMETSQLIRNEGNIHTCEKISFSQWNVNHPIHAISFITDETFPYKHSRDLEYFREQYLLRASYLTQKQRDLICHINREFTKQVCKDEEYEFTARLCHYLLHEFTIKGEMIGAILYPSVQTSGELGINIALSEEATNRFLEYEHLFECEIRKSVSGLCIEAVSQYNSQFEQIK